MTGREFVVWCDELISQLDSIRNSSDAGSDFADAIEPKIERMQTWAKEKGAVSQRMIDAVEQYERGMNRWDY